MVLQNSKASEQPVNIKQRVIGAIVLVSLGVIFIPMLLNSERSLDDGMPVFGSNIPIKPNSSPPKKSTVSEVQTSSAVIIKSQADFDSRVIIDEHSPSETTKLKNKTVASFASVDKKTTSETVKENTTSKKIITAKTTPVAKKPAKAWAIQVGSFADRKNAFSLRNKLRSQKFTAFVESVKTSNGHVYRVRVGPEIKREVAEKLQKKLVAELKIKGLVIAHP